MAFEIVASNKQKTVGVVTNCTGLKPVGDFKIADLEAWVKKIREIYGDGDEGFIRVEFKLAEDPKTPGYAILASIDGHEPHVGVCGEYLVDETPWEKV